MNQHISHSRNQAPRDFGLLETQLVWDLLNRFTYDQKIANTCI